MSFSGHPQGERSCEDHERHDPACIKCIEADSYCPHNFLLRHVGDHRGMDCWRPATKWDVPDD